LKCCLYETPYCVAAPIEKQAMSSCTYKDQIFFLVHKWCIPPRPDTGSYVLFLEEATRESSTINGLLYALEAL
jgi:hypothetical protein